MGWVVLQSLLSKLYIREFNTCRLRSKTFVDSSSVLNVKEEFGSVCGSNGTSRSRDRPTSQRGNKLLSPSVTLTAAVCNGTVHCSATYWFSKKENHGGGSGQVMLSVLAQPSRNTDYHGELWNWDISGATHMNLCDKSGSIWGPFIRYFNSISGSPCYVISGWDTLCHVG